jgi:hypothetical protein
MFERHDPNVQYAPASQPVSAADDESLGGGERPETPAMAGADRVIDRHASGASRVFRDANRQTGGE